MPKFTLYTRSFHSQKNFGIGGLGYRGDNRGFSNSPGGVTSRIHSATVFNIDGNAQPENQTGSDASFQPETGWSQNYSEPRTQPNGTATYQGTPHTQGAMQHITVTTHHGGQNFAMPGMNSSSKTERDIAYAGAKRVVPVLDVFGKLDIVFDPANKVMKINYVMTGDGFPDCEAFLVDEHGKSVFLATHIRYGAATGQLWGEKHLPMAETNIDVEMKDDYSFGDHVVCHKCWDYVDTGSGTIHFENGFQSGSVEQWNKLHSSRTTQSWMRWINDNKPGYSFDPNNPRYGLFGEYDPNNPTSSIPMQ